MKKIIFIIIMISLSSCTISSKLDQPLRNQCQEIKDQYHNLGSPEKMLLITAEDWQTFQATLQMKKRSSRFGWQDVGKSYKGIIGRNGMGLGMKWSHWSEDTGAPIKHEGDGKTPVGLHMLGEKFGFSSENNADENYRQLTENTYCVDDPESFYYNQIVSLDKNPKQPISWKSAEKMLAEPLYKIGAEIKYQSDPDKRSGSCIFLHISPGTGRGTSGCIALPEAGLKDVLEWSSSDSTVVAIFTQDLANQLLSCMD